MMRVAILGGWDENPARNEKWKVRAEEASRGQIIEACREIGARLARNQHAVIVGSEKKNSADYHVVHGMLAEIENSNASRALIEVIERIESRGPLYLAEREGRYSVHFDSIEPASEGPPIRAAEKILAVQNADAVITIGGLRDTWIGGIAAIVAKKLVMPIGTFGGASRKLLRALKSLDHALKSQDNARKLARLSNRVWHPDLIDTVFDLGGLNGDRVFFGYSGKASTTARKIIEYMRSLGLEVTDWAIDFHTGSDILEEVHAAVSSSKFGVFLFTPDDPTGEGEYQGSPRDNVIFEAGYFMGAHGRDRTRIIVQEGTKPFTDYEGYRTIQLKDASDISTIEDELRRALGLAAPAPDRT
jgi:hypothetical protein